MPVLSNSRHEAFCQARFGGMGVMEAYRAAGYEGATPRVASCVSQHPEVKARLRELHNRAGIIMAYERADAIKDLVVIIKAPPCSASEDHPLCETRSGRNGSYSRFPSKLRAMARLIKIMGLAETKKQARGDEPDRMLDFLVKERSRHRLRKDGAAPEEERDPDEMADISGLDAESAATLAATSVDPAAPLTPKQEAFAQARARGLGIRKSYQLAGYMGHSGRCAYRVNERAAVKARVAELREILESAAPDESYKKHHLANDLIAIIQAAPSEASDKEPLCETRSGQGEVYYRFPCKLQAMNLLARLMRWNAGDKATSPAPTESVDGADGMDRFLEGFGESWDELGPSRSE